MHEQQIITQIIDNKDIDVLEREKLQPKHFLAHVNIVNYILDYQQEFNEIPSRTTIVKEFPHFSFIDAEDSEEFLAAKLKETYLYTRLVPVLETSADKTRKDSTEAIKFLKNEIDALLKDLDAEQDAGKDIVADAEDRLKDYEERVEADGLLGIPSNIKQLDKILFGWMEEDLVTILARSGEGKSWLILYLLAEAWKQGKKVLLYSGEMSHLIVGYRLDTYLGHFSNRGLMSGNRSEEEEYRQHIADLKERDGFIVITPTDLGNKRPTTKDIERLIEIHEPDIVGIDQYSLMDDWQRGEKLRIQLENISADLFSISERMKVPILAVAQANRDAAKKNEGKEDPEPPAAHEIAEADGILRNSTRVLSIARVDNILKIAIRKNRYGEENHEILLNWQIDRGYISPILEDEKLIENEFGF